MGFESCLDCGACLGICFLEKMGIDSFVKVRLQENTGSIWNCTNCWNCQEICPAGINLMEIKWQMQQGVEPPESYAASFKNILLCGYCLLVEPDDLNVFRQDDDLEPITLASQETITTLLQIE